MCVLRLASVLSSRYSSEEQQQDTQGQQQQQLQGEGQGGFGIGGWWDRTFMSTDYWDMMMMILGYSHFTHSILINTFIHSSPPTPTEQA